MLCTSVYLWNVCQTRFELFQLSLLNHFESITNIFNTGDIKAMKSDLVLHHKQFFHIIWLFGPVVQQAPGGSLGYVMLSCTSKSILADD